MVSPRHRIASASTRSSIAPVVMATARRTCGPSTTSVMLPTMNFSLKLQLPDCQTTSCIHYYHHHQPHHNVMTLDSASTHSSCLNTLHTYRTVTFLCACYIKTNTSPTHSNSTLLFVTVTLCLLTIYLCTLCFVYCSFSMCGLHSVMP